jgi:hypothetical protein
MANNAPSPKDTLDQGADSDDDKGQKRASSTPNQVCKSKWTVPAHALPFEFLTIAQIALAAAQEDGRIRIRQREEEQVLWGILEPGAIVWK